MILRKKCLIFQTGGTYTVDLVPSGTARYLTYFNGTNWLALSLALDSAVYTLAVGNGILWIG